MRASEVSSAAPPAEWSALLAEAVSKPGVIHAAYSRFWNYSTGNQLLAWSQCVERGITMQLELRGMRNLAEFGGLGGADDGDGFRFHGVPPSRPSPQAGEGAAGTAAT